MARRVIAAFLLLAACGTSPSDRGSATVTLDALSGLPNPTWTLDSDQAEELLTRWDGLGTAASARYPEVLGYRALIVEFADGSRIWVSGGVAVDDSGGIATARTDPGRSLELWLLGTGASTVEATLFEAVETEIAG